MFGSEFLIITGDWHLRKDVPVCRSESEEDWLELQRKSVKQICDVSDRKIPIIHTGDLNHKSQPYYGIVNAFNEWMEVYNSILMKIAGNHDLPYHSWDNVQNSGWLASLGSDLAYLHKGAAHFGQSPADPDAEIIVTHQLVFEKDKDRPTMSLGKTAAELLEEFPKAKWIFTGDYHRNFHYEENGRHVVNPGCLTRQAADFADYSPGFYLVDLKRETVEWCEIGIDTAPLEIGYLEDRKEREGRMDAFIEVLQNKGAVSLSFEDNLEKALKKKEVGDDVREIMIEIQEEIA